MVAASYQLARHLIFISITKGLVMKLSLKVYTDPGHGWVSIKRDVLHMLGIANRVSHYSYQRGKTVYLEEDCDAALLIQAAKQTGIELSFEEKYTDRDSPIRSYDSYRALSLHQELARHQ